MNWKPLETFTDEIGLHVRALWVYSAATGKPIYFSADCGYLNDDGVFVNSCGEDDFGWQADDYDWWCEVPQSDPEAIKK